MDPYSSILGIDLGGTKTALALFDAVTMTQRSFKVIPTQAQRGFAAVQATLLEEIASMRTKDTVSIGLGVPGFIDHTTQTIVTMPNIPGAEGCRVRDWLIKETGLPVILENDARCFAYAESILGAGKGHAIVLGVTLGTGVGGGIVIDKKIFHGSHGYAGEVGHMLLQPGHPPYPSSDRRGDAEQFLSGTAMGKRCEAASSPQDYLEGQVCGFMQPEVFREVAWLIVNAVHTVDPSVVVFGGSAGRALKPHIPKIHKELAAWLLPEIKPPLIVCGELKDAAVLGAALLAKNLLSSL